MIKIIVPRTTTSLDEVLFVLQDYAGRKLKLADFKNLRLELSYFVGVAQEDIKLSCSKGILSLTIKNLPSSSEQLTVYSK